MLIERRLYQFTDPKLVQLVKQAGSKREKAIKAAKAFAKKYGASPNLMVVSNFDSGGHVSGFTFKKQPDMKRWRLTNSGDSYLPRRNTAEGRVLDKEFKQIPSWNYDEVMAAVKWKGIWIPHKFYGFNLFRKNDFCGICVPIFAPDTYKVSPDAVYKPVRGMKKITFKEYHRRFGK